MTPQKAKEKRSYTQAKRNEMNREMSANKRAAGLKYVAGKLPPDVVAARLAEIPEDTRSLTARVFGDPLPGRSALDRSARP